MSKTVRATLLRAFAALSLLAMAQFLALPTPVRAGSSDLSVSDYVYVSRARVGRSHYDYTYRVAVTNPAEALQNVVATATSTSPHTIIIDGVVELGAIDAGATVESSDTFTFRQNRRVRFDPQSIVWTFSADPSTPTNTPPVADAGLDQSLVFGNTVTLDGSGSTDADSDPLSYSWSLVQVPLGSTATLSDAGAVMPTFFADIPGDYVAQLIVNDGTDDSTPDSVVVSTSNTPPVADAGLDQTLPVGATAQLFAGASFDANGDPLTYAWSLLSTPPGSATALTALTGIQTGLGIDVAGSYVVQLIVNDGYDDSAPDEVTITTSNTPPVADAGPDVDVTAGDTATLDGTFSFDVDDDPLTYLWSIVSQPAGSSAFIVDALVATAQLVTDLDGLYVVQLIVRDGLADSTPDTSVVTATAANSPPTAVAGANPTSVAPGGTVQLDGSASSDPDNDPLTYAWSLQAPAGSSTALSSSTDVAPSFVADVAGTYVASLVVNDGNVDSNPATVNVTARVANTPPQLAAIGNRVMSIGATLDFRLFAIDPDVGDVLTFSLPVSVSGISINATTGDVSFTPAAAQLGTNNVTARVTDGAGAFDEQAFVIDVATPAPVVPANTPPTLSSFTDQTVVVGQTLSLQATAGDAEGTVSFSLPLAPAGMSIDATGLITFTPTPDQVGRHDVTVQVSDSAGASVFRSFIVTVNDVDGPPVAVDDLYTARIGGVLNVAAPGILENDSDPNGDALTATLVSDSTEGALNLNADGSFSYRPNTPINLVVPVPVSGNLAQLFEPVRFEVSSYRADDSPGLAVDGDPSTSWFTADGDAANLGATPFYELVFPQDVTVTDLEIDGNRNPADGFDFLEGVLQLFDEDGVELYTSGTVTLAAPDRDISLSVGSIDRVRRARFTGTSDESASPGFSEFRVLGSAVNRSFKFAQNVDLTRSGQIDVTSSPPNNDGLLGSALSAVDQSPISFWWDALDTVDPFYEVRFPAAEVTVREVQVVLRRNRVNGQPISISAFTSIRLLLLDSSGAAVYDSGLLNNLVPGEDVILSVPNVANVRTARIEGAPSGAIVGELRVIGDGPIWSIRPQLEWSWTEPDGGIAPGGTAFGNVSVTPLSADLDGDGFKEVIFSSSTSTTGGSTWPAYLVVLDGRTGNQVAILDDDTLRLDGPSTMAVGDIDDDGLPEIIATDETIRGLIAFENDLTVKWRSDPIIGTIWGSIAIANIDGTGRPEILAGTQVLNADGQLLWSGSSGVATGAHTIAADLDLDGQMEVLAGGGVFRSDGTLFWRNLTANPSPGVGNFDDDPYPEVVISGRNVMQVYEHDGTLKWERRNHIVGGGAPSIADYDGDGKPEIGQIAFRNYTVYDTDGRVMWQRPVLDGSTSTTSTVFDLDGDGSAEVIMRDEDFLKIFRGTDGELLFQMQLSSSTAGEGPMVADIDSDGQAEIVVPSTAFSRQLGTTKGIFVFGGFDGDWVRTREIWNQHSYHVTNVNEDLTIPGIERNSWLTPGVNSYRQQGYAPDDLGRLESFTYQAIGAGQQSNTATVMIDTEAPNAAPVITSSPVVSATIGFEYFYSVDASDADNDPLTFQLVEGPASMIIDPPTGLVRWMPTAADTGSRFVSVSVSDPGGKTATQRFSLSTNAAVVVPDVVGDARATAEATIAGSNLSVGTVTFAEHPTVPAGTVVAQTPPAGSIAPFGGRVDMLISLGAGPADIDDDNDGFTENLGDCDDADATIFPGATDIAGDGIDQDCDGSDAAVPPAQIVVSPAASTVLTGETVLLTATGIYGDGTSRNLTGVANWTNGPQFSSATAGSFAVTATVAGVTGNATVDVVATVTGDATAPVAQITAPQANATITEPVDVVGTASDANFLKYELAYAPAGETNFTAIATSTTPVVNGVLGRFDPTLLLNDLYTIRLTVFDTGGNQVVAETTVQVDGDMKVGNFTLSFTDLQIPISGMPIAITRTYDSRDRGKGDFGIGWRLGVQSIRIRSNRILGTGWQVVKSRLAFGLVPTDAHVVSVILPDGQVESFDLEISPNVSPLIPFPPSTTSATFRPRPGTLGSLESLDNNIFSILDPQPGTVELVDDLSGRTYNPTRFRYTGSDGNVYVISRTNGVESITDINGNRITITPSGLIASNGQSVLFDRDDENRITQITDPRGNSLDYAYDSNGDLRSTADAMANTTTFKYDRLHGLLEINDPLGNRALRTEYDDAGRLVAVVAADGSRQEFSYDIAGREQVQIDQLGNTSRLVYDERGNVLLREQTVTIDGVQQVAAERFEYDERDNEIARVDADGIRTERLFNEFNEVETETVDPAGLNLTTSFTYTSDGNILTRTDPLGNQTRYDYDARGNLTAVTDALGGQQSFAYDSLGRMVARQEPVGTTYVSDFDSFGRVSARRTYDNSGALISQTAFGYDANSNMVRETQFRYEGATLVGNDTLFAYDPNNKMVSATNPLGGEIIYEFDALGRTIAQTDPNGNRTVFEYDARGRLVRTINADLSQLSTTYDAKGNVVAQTDELGRMTSYAYDELDRRVSTLLPSGGTVREVLSPAGRKRATVDARGNRTDFEYDTAGRNTRVIGPAVFDDVSGTVTRPTVLNEYDAAGRQVGTTDSRGNRTGREYDVLGRAVRTTYADGSVVQSEYDAASRLIRITDELGRITRRDYDGHGNLVAVFEPSPNGIGPGPRTTYEYDLQGNLIGQTDALGMVTRYQFDSASRMTGKILPDGRALAMQYDAAGNLVGRTGYDGATISYEYDLRNNNVRSVFPDGAEVVSSYDAAGNRTGVSDAAGPVSFQFDTLDRIATLVGIDGVAIQYEYDLDGNQTRVATAAGVTDYSYDALNRLVQVDSTEGTTQYGYDLNGNQTRVLQPNGVSTATVFDTRNRVTSVTHRDSFNQVLMAVDYAYYEDGQRRSESVRGQSLRDYTYDGLNRLTNMVKTGQNPSTESFEYDPVGNRTSSVVDGLVTTYGYDVVGQLISAGNVRFAYDANGNRVAEIAPNSSTQYVWDARGRLTSFASQGSRTDLSYDALDRRVARAASAATTAFVVDSNSVTGYDQVLEERDAGGATQARYSYGTDLLSQIDTENRYVQNDAHGNTRLITDQNGVPAIAPIEYSSFGNLEDPSVTQQTSYLYAGEQLDVTTGLYYLRARYYDPATGVFLSRDPFGGEVEDPISMQPYIFAASNPINNIDPDGRQTVAELGISQSITNTMKAINAGTKTCRLLKRTETVIDAVSLLSASYVIMNGIDAALASRLGGDRRVSTEYTILDIKETPGFVKTLRISYEPTVLKIGGTLVTKSEGEVQLGFDLNIVSGATNINGGIDVPFLQFTAGCGIGEVGRATFEIRGAVGRDDGFLVYGDSPLAGTFSVGIGVTALGDLIKMNIGIFSLRTDGKGKFLGVSVP